MSGATLQQGRGRKGRKEEGREKGRGGERGPYHVFRRGRGFTEACAGSVWVSAGLHPIHQFFNSVIWKPKTSLFVQVTLNAPLA